MDAIFDAVQTFNAMGLLIGGLLMLGIGLVFIADWVLWRTQSYKVKACVAAVKSTGQRRSDDEWASHFKQEETRERNKQQDQKSFKESFREKPVSTGFAALFVGLFALMPFAFFGVGAYTAYNFLSLQATGVKTLGEVVDVESSYDSDSGYTYAPVMSYEDRLGNRYRETDSISSGSNKITKGQEVFLYYDMDNPRRFVLDRFWRYMGFAFAFMGFSSVFIGLFAIGFIKRDQINVKAQKAITPNRLKAKKRKHYANQMYTAIYEFVTPHGETIQAPGSVSSSSVADKLPGSKVTILVRPDKPDKVRKAGYLFLFIGLVFAAPGVFLTGLSFKMLAFTWGGILVIGGMLAFGLFKMMGSIRRGADRLSREDWAAHVKECAKQSIETGFILTPEEVRERYAIHERNMRYALPIMFIVAFGLMYGGYYWHNHVSDFTASALSAEGRVVGMNSRYSDGSYTYYPEVRFTTNTGEGIIFEDSFGSNPPTKRAGDRVQVLYDAATPRNAMIDRGIWNNVPALGILLAGILLLLQSLKVWHRQRTRRL